VLYIIITYKLRYDNLSDNHLRTAITIRITEKFPKESKDDSTRNKIKDNLLQIIKYSHNQVNKCDKFNSKIKF